MTGLIYNGLPRWHAPLLQSSNLTAFSPEQEHFVTSEDDGKTYRVRLNADEKLTASIFVDRGACGSQLFVDREELWKGSHDEAYCEPELPALCLANTYIHLSPSRELDQKTCLICSSRAVRSWIRVRT